MGRGPKVLLCVGCVAAAIFASGAGTAAVTSAGPAARGTVIAETVAATQTSQWTLAGSNSVDVAYDGTSFVYSVSFTQSGSSLSGTLTDSYYPTSGPISGTISGSTVTFTFNYPAGSIQGTRTYTGIISSSGAVSGSWTQTGDESPNNGTWSLASNAKQGSSSPTAACTAATKAFKNDQAKLNRLLGQLSAAQGRLKALEGQISDLSEQVDADNAVLKQGNELLSESQDDINIVNQDASALAATTQKLLDNPADQAADAGIEKIRTITLNSLDPDVKDINSDLADHYFERAAARASAGDAKYGEIIDIISSNLLKALALPAKTVLAAVANRFGTAFAVLVVNVNQLSALQDKYNNAFDNVDKLTAELNADKAKLDSRTADVNALTSQVNTAQTAAQAALNAMAGACGSSGSAE